MTLPRPETLLLLTLSATLLDCGGRQEAPPPQVAVETPADEILRIGDRWTAITQQRGLLSPPSQISVFTVREESQLTLSQQAARERIVVDEQLELRNGGTLLCQTSFEVPLGLKWGRREGEAAVELERPPLDGARTCQGGTHPEPRLTRPGGPVRFVLRSDNLVAVDPPTADRIYIPQP